MQPGKTADVEEEEPLPSFSVQMSEQLGGVRGLIESSIPITLFIVVNFLGDHFHWWSLRTSLIVAVGAALSMAAYRLSRRESVRHSINGVFGIAIGAYLAWKSGDAKDIYLPGMASTPPRYAVGMLASVAFRRPLVGWLWSVMSTRVRPAGATTARLRRTYAWLTVLWAVVYLAKLGVQSQLTGGTTPPDLLGSPGSPSSWPPYALLAAVWQARRVIRATEPAPIEAARPAD